MNNYIAIKKVKGHLKSMFFAYVVWQDCIGYLYFSNYYEAKASSIKEGNPVEVAAFFCGECVTYHEVKKPLTWKEKHEFIEDCLKGYEELLKPSNK